MKTDLLQFARPCASVFKQLLELDARLLFEMHCRLVINGFLIGENMVATAIYVEISRLDHACRPTASVTFDGNRAVVR